MTFMSWRSDYEVGVPQIDTEHRGLFDLVNAFHDSYARGDKRREISEMLSRLVAYAEEHFQHEEQLMRENAYPSLDKHAALHSDLVAAVFAINEELSADAAKAGMKTVQLLKNWLIEHILKSDMDFSEFLRRRSSTADRPAPAESGQTSANPTPATAPSNAAPGTRG